MLDWLRKKHSSSALDHVLDEIADEAERDMEARFEPVDWAPTVPMSVSCLDQDVPRRAAELRRLTALRARGETAFQYIAETAARICNMPMAGISILDGDMVRFKAASGLPLMSLPVSHAPCWFAMNSLDAVTVFADLTRDERFQSSPVTSGKKPLRFYAGARLLSGRDVPLGTVWVADSTIRDMTPVQLRTLELLARQTTLLLESRAQQRV